MFRRRVGGVALDVREDAAELDVAADFTGGDESVAETAARFRAAVARMMTETFGMEKPARIGIEILRSGADIQVVEAEVGAESETSRTETKTAEDASGAGSGQSC